MTQLQHTIFIFIRHPGIFFHCVIHCTIMQIIIVTLTGSGERSSSMRAFSSLKLSASTKRAFSRQNFSLCRMPHLCAQILENDSNKGKLSEETDRIIELFYEDWVEMKRVAR